MEREDEFGPNSAVVVRIGASSTRLNENLASIAERTEVITRAMPRLSESEKKTVWLQAEADRKRREAEAAEIDRVKAKDRKESKDLADQLLRQLKNPFTKEQDRPLGLWSRIFQWFREF